MRRHPGIYPVQPPRPKMPRKFELQILFDTTALNIDIQSFTKTALQYGFTTIERNDTNMIGITG